MKNDDGSMLPGVASTRYLKPSSTAKYRLFKETYLSNLSLTVAEITACCDISMATAFAWRADLRAQLGQEPIV